MVPCMTGRRAKVDGCLCECVSETEAGHSFDRLREHDRDS